MAGDTDFVRLYQQLGLDSGCTLEAFRQAYRKRVGALHPDRTGARAQATDQLQQLNALYAAAMEFHRRHGRLPGASQATGSAAGTVSGGAPAAVQPMPMHPAENRSSLRWMPIGLVLVIAVLWIFSLQEADEPAAPSALASARAVAEIPHEPHRPVPKPTAMTLGISAQQVRALHGDPVSGWEQRWEYGPSWVAFRCGVVVDWYSSPLRPLRVETEHPPATTQWSPPRNCKE
jgi:hypothetical protein